MKTSAYAISLVLAGTLGISGISFAEHPNVSPKMGTPIHEGKTFRTIVIDSKTRSVNVYEGQKVKFVVKTAQGEKQFSWKFDTRKSALNLNDIAPTGTLDNMPVTAYVEPDPDGIWW